MSRGKIHPQGKGTGSRATAKSSAQSAQAQAGKLRCAIYTRVSSDAGLEQEFNSLDNQREAAEAHIRAQQFEGWSLLDTPYDDGGFSGGSMERPGLQRLLEDVRAGLIDIIVVYKVDRLTRSLADFAKLVELFDAHGVSFVSVTQSFNTTTSMGRLTLNVLLSFAQFEREVTGERIRDKIAASKKKGIWMGGTVPYGYRVENRKLLIEPGEAEDIRMIFERYRKLSSVPALVSSLRAQGFVTRQRTLGSGRTIGGVPLTNGPLAVILKNRVYLGEINHKGQSFAGEHEPIIDGKLFDAVQSTLAANRRGSCDRWRSSGALLMGRIHDDRGNRMTPAHANKYPGGTTGAAGRVRYRYYVSCAIPQGRKQDCGSAPRVAAHEIEELVVSALRSHVANRAAGRAGDELRFADSCADNAETEEQSAAETSAARQELSAADLIARHLDRVIVGPKTLTLHLKPEDQGATPPEPITIPWSRPVHTRKRAIILPQGATQTRVQPIRAEARARLIAAIARARAWVAELTADPQATTTSIAARDKLSERSLRMTLPLAFLSPATVRAAIDGTLPFGTGVMALAELPMGWEKQGLAIAEAGRIDPRRCAG
jgi:DNA invertase Pin-like site-specific DNA recombinase